MGSSKPTGRPNGRPLFDGKDVKTVLAKLEEAAAIDASVEEMCFYADISKNSYYNYVEAHEDFHERILKLRERPVMLARQTAVKKVTESYQNAMDYLRRKRKDEFSEKKEVEHSGSLTISKVLDELEDE